MKILVIGGAGQLGSDIVKVGTRLGQEMLAPSHSDLPLEAVCTMKMHDYITEHRPDYVINCAAMHNILVAETFPSHAFLINSTGQLKLAEVCDFFNIPLIYISTNYVFDGYRTRFYDPSDSPNPLQVYGQSKLIGEYFTRVAEEGYVIRTSGLFGVVPPRGKDMNFVDLVVSNLEQGKEMYVKDWEFISPTYTLDLASAIFAFYLGNNIIGKPRKVTHVVNAGVFTWYAFAKCVALMYNPEKADLICPKDDRMEEHPPRPRGAMLNSTVPMPLVEDALKRYLKEKYGKEVSYESSNNSRSEGSPG